MSNSKLRNRRPKLVRWLNTGFLVAMTPVALFYLFVVPVLAARHPKESGALEVGFGAFMLMQLLLLVAEFAYESAASFYKLKRTRLITFLEVLPGQRKRESAPAENLLYMFLSYILLNYAFAVIYLFLSNLDNAAFSTRRPLGLLEAFYFSTVTAATVGYGDVAPTGSWSRLVVTIQVYLSLLYAVLLFGACSSYFAARKPDKSGDQVG